MLSTVFIRFVRSFNNKNNNSLDCILDLGRLGLRIADEYSTRFDLLDINKCIYLSNFQTPALEKAEKHLLNLVPIDDPLFSLMEYYDNYPYSYSDINYLFKGCLKSGVEITIKAVNPSAKKIFLKNLSNLRNKIKYYNFFFPWMEKKYKINEVIDSLEINNCNKFDLIKEIKSTKILQEYLDIYKGCLNLHRLKFPKIYSYLSSESKIVSEYVYGNYFYELLAYNKLAYRDVLDLIKIQLFFILNVGVYHNNLHSGNLILSDEGEFHFLDCNTIAYVSTEKRILFFKLLKSICKEKYEEVARIINSISEKTIDDKQLEIFSNKILSIFNCNSTLIAKLMKCFKLGYFYGMSFDLEVFSIFKSFLYLDKLVNATKRKSCYFEEDLLKILDEIEPFIVNNN